MQAISVSRDLRDKFERICRDGREQYALAKRAPAGEALGHLLDAQVHFAQAWAVADCAVLLAPAKQYARWSDARGEAAQAKQTCRRMIDGLVGAARQNGHHAVCASRRVVTVACDCAQGAQEVARG